MVQKRVAAALLLVVPVADRAPEFAVTTAVGDAAELLDVDVDQVTRIVVFVAARPWRPYGQAGGLVKVA